MSRKACHSNELRKRSAPKSPLPICSSAMRLSSSLYSDSTGRGSYVYNRRQEFGRKFVWATHRIQSGLLSRQRLYIRKGQAHRGQVTLAKPAATAPSSPTAATSSASRHSRNTMREARRANNGRAQDKAGCFRKYKVADGSRTAIWAPPQFAKKASARRAALATRHHHPPFTHLALLRRPPASRLTLLPNTHITRAVDSRQWTRHLTRFV